MPTYVYECKKCNHSFEELQALKSEPLVTCPSCNEDELYKVICPTFVRGEPRTLGSLAEYNTKKMGSSELARKREEHKTKEIAARNEMRRQTAAKQGVEIPQIKSSSDGVDLYKLGNLSKEKQQKYIQTGEM